MEENNEDIVINELTEKLKEQMSNVGDTNKEYGQEKDPLKKENLEKYLIEKGGELVEEGLDTIRELKSVFINNPDAEEIDALSQAFKAVSSALSVLKDLQVASMKVDSTKQIKEMEIKAKKELKEQDNSNDTQKIYLTRDEVFKQLLEKAEVIDGEFKKED